MDDWIRGYKIAVREGVVVSKLEALPSVSYEDERVWNKVYVEMHDSLTAGPLIGLVIRFVRHMRPDHLSLEHRAFIERVAIDGLERNPPRLIHHRWIAKAADLYESLVWIRRDTKLAPYAEMFCSEKSLETDVDAYASVVLHRVHTLMTKKTVPGTIERLTRVIGNTKYSNWMKTYDALLSFSRKFNGWTDEERHLLFERFVHAAGVAEDPHPWLIAAATLYSHSTAPDPTSTPALRSALRRVQSDSPLFRLCDPWYVSRLSNLSPYT